MVENPIWKTSYRLVLNKEGKPSLQGWAIVENPSDEDWSGVRMALISGRPISFQMDLYQPLYVPRPTVEPELFASLRPPTYSGAMEERERTGVSAWSPLAPSHFGGTGSDRVKADPAMTAARFGARRAVMDRNAGGWNT